MNKEFDHIALLERAINGNLWDEDVAIIVQSLENGENKDLHETFLFILGRSYKLHYQPLITKFLINRDGLVAAMALKMLADYWGGTADYLETIITFLQGNDWDTSCECQALAMRLSGSYLQTHMAKELLVGLFYWLDRKDVFIERDMWNENGNPVGGIPLVELESITTSQVENRRRENIRRYAFNAIMKAIGDKSRVYVSLSEEAVTYLNYTIPALNRARARLDTEPTLGYGIHMSTSTIYLAKKVLRDINIATQILSILERAYITDELLIAAQSEFRGNAQRSKGHLGLHGVVYLDPMDELEDARRYRDILFSASHGIGTEKFPVSEIQRWQPITDKVYELQSKILKYFPPESTIRIPEDI